MNYSRWLFVFGAVAMAWPSSVLAREIDPTSNAEAPPAAPAEESPAPSPEIAEDAAPAETAPASEEDAAESAGEPAAPPGAAVEAETGASSTPGSEEAADSPSDETTVPSEGPELPSDGAEGEEGESADAEKPTKSKSHERTIGISLAPGFGYGMTLAGDKFCGAFSNSADDSDGRRPVCSALTPAYLDIGLSYGVSKRIELVVGARVNLQRRSYDASKCDDGEETCAEGEGLFVDKLAAGLFPGIRIWGKGVERTVKLGVGIDFIVMFEKFDGYRDRPRFDREEAPGSVEYETNRADEAAVGDVQLGMRVGPVLAIDPHHNFGLFFFPSLHPSFRPSRARELDSGWLQIGVDFSAGIQARFP